MSLTLADGRARVERIDQRPLRPVRRGNRQTGQLLLVSALRVDNAGRRTNALAIAALCCGVAQVAAGIPAIVLGAMSLKQISRSAEDGRGMAMTGLALGVVGTILLVLGVVVAALITGRVASNPNF